MPLITTTTVKTVTTTTTANGSTTITKTVVTQTPVIDTNQEFQSFRAPVRPIQEGNGWDFHVYYSNELGQREFIDGLWARAKKEFPTVEIEEVTAKPRGPHTLPMFKAIVNTPAEFGAFLSWIATNRGDLSVLVHPLTGNDLVDHTTHAVWCGEKVPLKLEVLH
ncbi:hypothetical protein BCR33DRAFT_846841 [Rhizoclosmatium globosum]|uniref:Dopa 4,5-dioxygenase n=1 Tax=Rhizoclosmatium globosum TaxID=329046 RepID=A0A1Y2CTK3_9FUNG|nr:hypothetical protein BCR33DRAFT_846841 [Rhizoclosmatium globosum]|eukprot:ORY50322.1 hypothetical protein BCR33DRAFT_846841 [Rhizoclosmatium globosum]